MTNVEPPVPGQHDDGSAWQPDDGGGPGGWRRRQWYVVGVIALAVALAAAVVALVAHNRSTPTAATTTTTTSTSAPTTSTTTSSVPAPPVGDHSSAVWPVTTVSPYTDPVAGGRSFAVDFAGFASRVMGAFGAGDSRSGGVGVRR
jgi:hypothetical protein